MSRKYKHGDRVPSKVLVSRMRELVKAITARDSGQSLLREFVMRIPAELDHDADLVISTAATRLESQSADIAELKEAIEKIYEKVSPYVGCLDSVEENGGEESEEVLEAVFHIAYYASFIAKHSGGGEG